MAVTIVLAIDGGPPVRKEFLVFGKPVLGEEEIAEVVSSIRSGWIGTGPKVHAFEKAFGDYIGAKHAVAVNSCTAALHLSLLAAGVGQGHEVITTPITFGSTANSIVHTGAVPVFVDVDPLDQNISADLIEAAVTAKTRALLPVHFAGYPAPMDEIMSLAKDKDIFVLEDAAHCIEGWYKGRKIGTIGGATCFSFYVTKNLTTVEGGMVTTEDDQLAGVVKTLALHGLSADAWRRYSDSGYTHYEVLEPGFKYNMTDIQASFGIHQLAKLERHGRRREEIWSRYEEAFSDLPVDLPSRPGEGSVHALHLYTVRLRLEALTVDRDRVLNALQAENIGCGVHYVGVHLHSYYRKRFGLKPEDFPVATAISERTLSLPFSGGLSDRDVDDVVETFRKVISAYRR